MLQILMSTLQRIMNIQFDLGVVSFSLVNIIVFFGVMWLVIAFLKGVFS